MNTALGELFSDHETLRDEHREARVNRINFDRDRRSIEVWMFSDVLLDKDHLRRLSDELKSLYSLNDLTIHCRYNNLPLTPDYAPMLAQHIAQVCPACRGFLEDAEMVVEDNRVRFLLQHGGGESLARSNASRLLSQLIEEEFGTRYEVCFEGELELRDFSQDLQTVRTAIAEEARKAAPAPEVRKQQVSDQLYGRRFDLPTTPMREVDLDSGTVAVSGEVFGLETRISKNKQTVIVSFNLTDLTSSLPVKLFPKADQSRDLLAALKDGMYIKVRGDMQMDRYTNELSLMARDIVKADRPVRLDKAPKKRVELHLHTTMSQMDAVTPVQDYLKRAAQWEHPAIAITDHGVLQAYPDACNGAKKAGFTGKILYGIESYFINDGDASAETPLLDEEMVIFDVETTGLSARNDRLTEIGAVLIKDGAILDRFQTFVNPGMPIPGEIVKLTGITDEMVADAPSEAEAVAAFLRFA
ncbi:MAG: PHP domain-containing protein, partial [Clostridia bacterium]|nr:PHP domain-containing protein [Clostridia bacterium]